MILCDDSYCVSSAFGVIVDYFWSLNCTCPQVSTPVLSFIRTFKFQENWLAICLGYYELCMLLVLFFQFLPETSKKHICCLNFLLSKLIWTQKCFCFFQMFCIQYFIWDSKTLRFPCCRSSFGHKIGLKKKNTRSPAASLGKFMRAGLTFGKLSQTAKQLLAKSKHDFQQLQHWKCQEYVVPHSNS